MSKIKLTVPTIEYKDKALQFKKEFLDNNENVINGSELLDKTESYEEWLQSVTNNADIKTVNPEWVLTDTFFAVDDNEEIVGIIDLRHELNEFLQDFGKPCIAGRPRTKAKVEAPMKILDEIRAYNGKLDYDGLNKLVTRINNRVNTHVVKDTGIIPIMYFNKEKASLSHLPVKNIRKPYQITTKPLNVNPSSMINYGGNQYSVPTEYIGKSLTAQAYDGYIHLYYNTTLVTVHRITEQKLNYHEKDYIEIARKSHSFKEEDIESRAKENLALLGGISGHEHNISAT